MRMQRNKEKIRKQEDDSSEIMFLSSRSSLVNCTHRPILCFLYTLFTKLHHLSIPSFISFVVIDSFIFFCIILSTNNVGSKTMSNFSYTAYYAQLTLGQNGCVGRAAFQADTKHARNVNNGKLKKKRIFRFCGSKFGYFRLFCYTNNVLYIFKHCLTWSEVKKGPRGTRNRPK